MMIFFPLGFFISFPLTLFFYLGSFSHASPGVAQALSAGNPANVFTGVVEQAPASPKLTTPATGGPAVAVDLSVDKVSQHKGKEIRTSLYHGYRMVPFVLRTPHGRYAVAQGFPKIEGPHPWEVYKPYTGDRALKAARAWSGGAFDLDCNCQLEADVAALVPGETITVIGQAQGKTLAPTPQAHYLVAATADDLRALMKTEWNRIHLFMAFDVAWVLILILLRRFDPSRAKWEAAERAWNAHPPQV